MKTNMHHNVLKYAARKVRDTEEYIFFHDDKVSTNAFIIMLIGIINV